MKNYKLNWVSEKEFVVTEDHLKLIRKMIINWNDSFTGAPQIDPLQPYGSTCISCDIAKILKIKPKYNNKTKKLHFSDEQTQYMKKVHQETKVVLQIMLRVDKVEAGTYIQEGWQEWRKVDD